MMATSLAPAPITQNINLRQVKNKEGQFVLVKRTETDVPITIKTQKQIDAIDNLINDMPADNNKSRNEKLLPQPELLSTSQSQHRSIISV